MKITAFVGCLMGLLIIVLKIENMLLSSLLAFVISYLLGPVVNSMERFGIHRVIAALLSFAVVGLLLTLGIVAILPLIVEQVGGLKQELPKYVAGLTRIMSDVQANAEALVGSYFDIDIAKQVESAVAPWTQALFEDLPAFVTKSVTTLLLAPFLAFFMIKDGKLLTRNLLNLVPNSIFEPTLNLYHQINEQMGHFVRARLLEALIVGVVTWIGLFIIEFPFATILALFAALTNLIPYIGPIIGAIPALAIAIINGESNFGLFLVGSVYLTAQLIDAAFILPVVVAKIVDLHPITVVVSIMAGAQLLGVVGMLISIPVASILKVTVSTVYRHLTDYREV
ncbi:MAG: AI-2E family transporter [Pseudomonadota bacterium]